MENKGIEGDEAKINFIAGYLRGKAWNWFEPILREKRTEKKADWSDRTTCILGSYKEMEKAMAQVFGDVDERRQPRNKNFGKSDLLPNISSNFR